MLLSDWAIMLKKVSLGASFFVPSSQIPVTHCHGKQCNWQENKQICDTQARRKCELIAKCLFPLCIVIPIGKPLLSGRYLSQGKLFWMMSIYYNTHLEFNELYDFLGGSWFYLKPMHIFSMLCIVTKRARDQNQACWLFDECYLWNLLEIKFQNLMSWIKSPLILQCCKCVVKRKLPSHTNMRKKNLVKYYF